MSKNKKENDPVFHKYDEEKSEKKDMKNFVDSLSPKVRKLYEEMKKSAPKDGKSK